MYLFDAIASLGLFLLFPSTETSPVLMLGLVAVVQQSKFEDRYLERRFTDEFDSWKKRSKLILPFIA